jgi:hypothetical protein
MSQNFTQSWIARIAEYCISAVQCSAVQCSAVQCSAVRVMRCPGGRSQPEEGDAGQRAEEEDRPRLEGQRLQPVGFVRLTHQFAPPMSTISVPTIPTLPTLPTLLNICRVCVLEESTPN